jgi:RNA polymerase sigma factor (sigma-70 family)
VSSPHVRPRPPVRESSPGFRTTTSPAQPLDRREQDLVALVQAARDGDAAAWQVLVARFDATLRQIARSYRLAPADVDDAVQAAWLQLLTTIDRIREPAAIGGWLTTVTRRNALRSRRVPARELLSDDPQLGDRHDVDGPEETLLAAEREAVLAAAIGALPERPRSLMTALLSEPELDYRQVGEKLSMPVGSIGPSRTRALARLARDTQLRAVAA